VQFTLLGAKPGCRSRCVDAPWSIRSLVKQLCLVSFVCASNEANALCSGAGCRCRDKGHSQVTQANGNACTRNAQATPAPFMVLLCLMHMLDTPMALINVKPEEGPSRGPHHCNPTNSSSLCPESGPIRSKRDATRGLMFNTTASLSIWLSLTAASKCVATSCPCQSLQLAKSTADPPRAAKTARLPLAPCNNVRGSCAPIADGNWGNDGNHLSHSCGWRRSQFLRDTQDVLLPTDSRCRAAHP
jgi:hypothetical protein